MLRAIERGLAVADFEKMTLGMVLDYLITCNNDEVKGSTRRATAADIEAF